MKFFINSILILLLSCSVFAQNWSVHFSPRFRVLNDVHIHNPEEIVIIGGRPFNDSITYMAYSSTAGQTWDIFTDIFPGKMINTAIFKNNITGYCAGQNEAFYKTIDGGKTWSPFNIGINLNHKNINKLFKSEYNVFFATGGLNNENGFLLKSSDGGNTWSSIYNWASNEIITAASPKTNTIIVGGLNGFLQISTDGAESWQNCNYPNLEILPEITGINFFDNNNGFCCGGVRGQDSTAIILKTTDGGSNWTISLNTTAPRLNDICMASEQVIYAVGDYGTVLKSEDGGTSWNEENIDGNPGVDLFAVNFLNTHLGAISGRYGYVMIFDDGQTNLPEVSTLEATKVTTSSAILNAVINPGFSDSEVSFLYGTNDNTEHEINCGTFSGGELKSIEKSISNLETDTKYYFRAKLNNSYGEYYGNIKYFYTGNPIPNWDFEEWIEISEDFPESWYIANAFFERVTYEGFDAIRLQKENNLDEEKDFAVLRNTLIKGNGPPQTEWQLPINFIHGGLPLNTRPNTLFLTSKYNIEPNDTSAVFIGLILDDHYVAENIFFLTGSQQNFETNAFPIEYSTDEIPEKAVIVIVSSNPFDKLNSYDSYIEISEIHFSDNTPEIPNSDFSSWITKTTHLPQDWYMKIIHNYDGSIKNYIERVTDAAHNDYAIKLQNIITEQDTITAQLSLRDYNEGMPIEKRFNKLMGYFKYFPESNDTARISIVMYQGGSPIAWGQYLTNETIDSWTEFNIDIQYHHTHQFTIPDSMNISFASSQYPPTGESQPFIDKLSLDGDFIPVKQYNINDLNLYPNPASDFINIDISNIIISTNLSYEIFDITGKLIVKEILDTNCKLIEINLNNFPNGLYSLQLLTDNSIYTSKFLKL